MSPTLDIVRDFSRFVITFFDLISTSTPHIYHSALLLSPRTSIVHELYNKYARSSARVVHGSPTSWGPVTATAYDRDFSGAAAWSPCNRFIAVAKRGTVEIRDAVTLNLLHNFRSHSVSTIQALNFSPDSRLLTQINYGDMTLVTWDLQTGRPVESNYPEDANHVTSSTHSIDGKMIAVVYSTFYRSSTLIATHDLFTSRTQLHPLPEGRIISPIWTHGEFIRFAIVKSRSIAIWEAEFTSKHPFEVVESLPAPDEINDFDKDTELLFLPSVLRLAIAARDALSVWDVRDSKLLLKTERSFPLTFSSDGHLFVSQSSREIRVWKESPAGYILHQKLPFAASDESPRPLLSPNGESVFISLPPKIHLWHTTDPILPSGLTPVMDQNEFILGFSSSEPLVASARYLGNTATVLDLQSGDPQLTIDTGGEVDIECLGVTGSTIVVVGTGKIATWDLATGNARPSIRDSLQITTLDPSPPARVGRPFTSVSISPDLSRVAALGPITKSQSVGLEIYDASTGRCLAGTTLSTGVLKSLPTLDGFKVADISEGADVLELRFTLDGREIWGVSYNNSSAVGWGIVEDEKYGATKLQPLGTTTCPPEVLPWRSSHGYEVTDDGWVLSPTRKKLLWLPIEWRLDERFRTWNGRFLGLRHRELLEPVILEFLD